VAAPLERYTSEWVELYNTTAEQIDLRGWRIDDADEGGALRLEGILDPGSYLVITLSRAILNNSGDTVSLFGPDGTLIDSLSYRQAERDMSFDRDMLTGVWGGGTAETPTTTSTLTAMLRETRIPIQREPSSSLITAPTIHAPLPAQTVTRSMTPQTTPLAMDSSGKVYQFSSTAEIVPDSTAPPLPLEATALESDGEYPQLWMIFSGLGLIILACLLVMSRPIREVRWDL